MRKTLIDAVEKTFGRSIDYMNLPEERQLEILNAFIERDICIDPLIEDNVHFLAINPIKLIQLAKGYILKDEMVSFSALFKSQQFIEALSKAPKFLVQLIKETLEHNKPNALRLVISKMHTSITSDPRLIYDIFYNSKKYKNSAIILNQTNINDAFKIYLKEKIKEQNLINFIATCSRDIIDYVHKSIPEKINKALSSLTPTDITTTLKINNPDYLEFFFSYSQAEESLRDYLSNTIKKLNSQKTVRLAAILLKKMNSVSSQIFIDKLKQEEKDIFKKHLASYFAGLEKEKKIEFLKKIPINFIDLINDNSFQLFIESLEQEDAIGILKYYLNNEDGANSFDTLLQLENFSSKISSTSAINLIGFISQKRDSISYLSSLLQHIDFNFVLQSTHHNILASSFTNLLSYGEVETAKILYSKEQFKTSLETSIKTKISTNALRIDNKAAACSLTDNNKFDFFKEDESEEKQIAIIHNNFKESCKKFNQKYSHCINDIKNKEISFAQCLDIFELNEAEIPNTTSSAKQSTPADPEASTLPGFAALGISLLSTIYCAVGAIKTYSGGIMQVIMDSGTVAEKTARDYVQYDKVPFCHVNKYNTQIKTNIAFMFMSLTATAATYYLQDFINEKFSWPDSRENVEVSRDKTDQDIKTSDATTMETEIGASGTIDFSNADSQSIAGEIHQPEEVAA